MSVHLPRRPMYTTLTSNEISKLRCVYSPALYNSLLSRACSSSERRTMNCVTTLGGRSVINWPLFVFDSVVLPNDCTTHKPLQVAHKCVLVCFDDCERVLGLIHQSSLLKGFLQLAERLLAIFISHLFAPLWDVVVVHKHKLLPFLSEASGDSKNLHNIQNVLSLTIIRLHSGKVRGRLYLCITED